MNHSGMTIAKQRETEPRRTGEGRPVRGVDPRRPAAPEPAKQPHPPSGLREDWFDRTFEQLRGFLDEMFR